VRADDAKRIVGMFQTIEDVPEATFDAGVPWTWGSVGEGPQRGGRRMDQEEVHGALPSLLS
jgi:hypothetical protein